MRVLWFSPTPSLNRTGKGNYYNGGGWISSLERCLKEVDDVDLGIAYFSDAVSQLSVEHNEGTCYYIMPKGRKGLLAKIGTLFKSSAQASMDDEREVVPGLLDVVNAFRPDVIQVFGSENKYGLVARYTECPTVLHIQGILNPCLNVFLPPGMSWGKYVFQGLNPKTILANLAEKVCWEKNILTERRILRSVDYVMGRTAWDRRVMAVMAPQARYVYCTEALRPVFYSQGQVRQLPGKHRFITVISYPLYKGLDLLLKTAKVLRENTDIEFEWRVYGVAGGKWAEKAAGVKAREVGVRLMGTANAETLKDELLNCTAMVHPSYIENTCLSIVEAQLCGTTPIAAGTGGVRTTIRDGETGLLAAPNDPWEMASCIKWVALHPAENLAMGAAARREAMLRHDPEKIKETVLHTYRSMIDAQRPIKH